MGMGRIMISAWPIVIEPGQTKLKLRKFLESMIQKSGKMRSLVREINENFTKEVLPLFPFVYVVLAKSGQLFLKTSCPK